MINLNERMLPTRQGSNLQPPDHQLDLHSKIFHFSKNIYMSGTHQKGLCEALLMSTRNICFHGKIRKISTSFGWKKHLTWCYDITGIKHGFSCINIRQVPWEVLKTRAYSQYMFSWRNKKNINNFWLKKKHLIWYYVCLCWGFTAQSTQQGHVERSQFT